MEQDAGHLRELILEDVAKIFKPDFKIYARQDLFVYRKSSEQLAQL